MKILMVYPRYADTFWSYKYALSIISKKTIYPPLGLLTVAAMLPAQWQKRLVDMSVTELRDEDILWADYIFISAMQVQSESAREVIARCNILGRKVVAGGPLFASGYDEFEGVSHFVLGEAEETLPRFLEDLHNGCEKRVYEWTERPDLATTPIPLWRLINMNDYASMNIQYSRGCPFECEFCDIVSLYGRRPRTKTTGQMLAELDALYTRDWRGQVFIVDDNFIGNTFKLKNELLPAMIEWSRNRRYPFYFLTEASIDLADDDELMTLMNEAGFTQLFVGIETPSEESLNECNKIPNKNKDLMASVKKLQNFGFVVKAGFIIGFDSDPISIFDTQIDFIQKTGIVEAMVGLLNAPKGTRLFDRLKKEGRLLDAWYGDNTDGSVNFVPKMSRDILLNGYKRVMTTIYSPSVYYERVQTFFKEYRPQARQSSRIEWNYIVSLIKSFWFLGIVEKGRAYFWISLVMNLVKYPHFFWQSVIFSIYRVHFYKLSQRLPVV